MSTSYTTTTTFTRTHAKELAAKVISDLNECAIFYGHPAMADLPGYQTELIELLAAGYVKAYEFGFKRNGECIVAWRYTVGPDGSLTGSSDSPGKLHAQAKTSGATYYNFLTFNSKWYQLTTAQQAAVEKTLPFKRGTGALPARTNGYWSADHTYSAGGTSLSRETFRT